MARGRDKGAEVDHSPDKKRRRARRKKKERETRRRPVDRRQQESGTGFLALATLACATLATAAGVYGYNVARDRIDEHGACFACIFEGPFQLVFYAALFGAGAVVFGLRWLRVLKKNAMLRDEDG